MPFGEETDAEQGKQNFKYNGKELDKEHGLNQYDYAARFMDPSMVRFTTVDPHAENYFSWSPYAYVGNNPMRLVDPDGKDWRDFLNGIIDGAKQRVDNIVYAVSNPEKTLENALKPAGSVDQVILNAADNASMGTVSTVINTGQAIYSDINGGDGSATGQLIGRTAVDAGVAVAAGKAGEVVGKGVSALSKGASKVVSSGAVEQSTALRQVGTALESVDDIMANPSLLKGKSPLQVEGIIGKTSGWQVETLGKGSQKGNGWVLREYTPKGNPTGSQLRWHPGGWHHGSGSYWRVVGRNGDLGGIIK